MLRQFKNYFFLLLLSFSFISQAGMIDAEFWDAERRERDNYLESVKKDPARKESLLKTVLVVAHSSYSAKLKATRESDKSYFFNQNPEKIIADISREIDRLIDQNTAYNFDQQKVALCNPLLDWSSLEFTLTGRIGVTSKDELLDSLKEELARILKAYEDNPSYNFDNCSKSIRERYESMHNLITSRFPGKKYLITLSRYGHESIQSILFVLRHELAHITQRSTNGRMLHSGTKNERLIRIFFEIDADLKGLCFRNSDGYWVLQKDYKKYIESIIEMCKKQDQCWLYVVDQISKHENSDKQKELYNDFMIVLNQMNNDDEHPPVLIREKLMYELVSIINKSEGKQLTDIEFKLAVVGIAKKYFKEASFDLNDNFLKYINEEYLKIN